MKKILLVITFATALFLVVCDDSSDDSSSGGSGSSFLGSCTDQASYNLCVDYYTPYTSADAQYFCSSSGDTLSVSTCDNDNPSLSKISGKCKITDNNYSGGISYVTYYTSGYTLITATLHCASYQSIPGYSSEWINE